MAHLVPRLVSLEAGVCSVSAFGAVAGLPEGPGVCDFLSLGRHDSLAKANKLNLVTHGGGKQSKGQDAHKANGWADDFE